jgi:phage shock protein B
VDMGEGIFVVLIVGTVFGTMFIGLPWMILHYWSKARSSGSLSEEDQRMLEDLWRSARAMERRIDTLERLLEAEPGQQSRPSSERMRGDFN